MSAHAGYSRVPVQGVMFPVRIVQMIFGVAVFAIACYQVSLFNGFVGGSAYTNTAPLALFTGLATMIFLTYYFVATRRDNSSLYNYWALFAVEAFVLLFWLVTWALYANLTASLRAASSFSGSFDSSSGSSGSGSSSGSGNLGFCYAGICVKHKVKRSLSTDPYSATTYTALALSLINFLLFCFSFVIFTINMFRHRKALSGGSHPQAQSKEAAGPTYAMA